MVTIKAEAISRPLAAMKVSANLLRCPIYNPLAPSCAAGSYESRLKLIGEDESHQAKPV